MQYYMVVFSLCASYMFLSCPSLKYNVGSLPACGHWLWPETAAVPLSLSGLLGTIIYTSQGFMQTMRTYAIVCRYNQSMHDRRSLAGRMMELCKFVLDVLKQPQCCFLLWPFLGGSKRRNLDNSHIVFNGRSLDFERDRLFFFYLVV